MWKIVYFIDKHMPLIKLMNHSHTNLNISLNTKRSNQFTADIVPYRQLSTSAIQGTW
jgi:hypothetical protein